MGYDEIDLVAKKVASILIEDEATVADMEDVFAKVKGYLTVGIGPDRVDGSGEGSKEEPERRYVPFTNGDAEKLTRDGERYISRGFVKTYGFEEAIAFTMSMTEQIWGLIQENKSLRMELYYDAGALNTNYCFFAPIDRCGSDGTSQVSPEDRC